MQAINHYLRCTGSKYYIPPNELMNSLRTVTHCVSHMRWTKPLQKNTAIVQEEHNYYNDDFMNLPQRRYLVSRMHFRRQFPTLSTCILHTHPTKRDTHWMTIRSPTNHHLDTGQQSTTCPVPVTCKFPVKYSKYCIAICCWISQIALQIIDFGGRTLCRCNCKLYMRWTTANCGFINVPLLGDQRQPMDGMAQDRTGHGTNSSS